MNLIVRVLLMIACVFTAYAWPNLGATKDNVALRTVIAQLQNALYQPMASNSTQNSCFVTYNNRIDNITAQTANQTQACYNAADKAIAANNNITNNTLNSINAQSRNLQSRLANCTARNSSEAVFNCNIAAFDLNLNELYTLTVQSQVAASNLSNSQYEVDIQRQSCIGNVLIGSQINSTQASNDLQLCLNNSTSGGSNSTAPGNRTMIHHLLN